MPDSRFGHTMDGKWLCGGSTYFKTSKKCMSYTGSSWEPFPVDLLADRIYHVSWKRPDGKLVLMGGQYSSETSEIMDFKSKPMKGFEMKYPTR